MADASKVLATRNMNAYAQTYAEDNDLPADTVDFGGDWSTDGWDGPYYTDGGLTADISVDRTDVNVDQEIWPVLRPITGGTVTFGTDLAEYDVLNLPLAVGVGETTTVAATSTDRGHDDYDVTSEFSQSFTSFAFEAEQQNGEAVRGIVYKGIPTGSPSMQFGQADQKAMIRFEMQAIPGAESATHPVARIRRILPATG